MTGHGLIWITFFYYIIRTRDFQRADIGHYKDEKAYSFIVNLPIKSYFTFRMMPQKLFTKLELSWVEMQDNAKILTSWCTCMAGTSQCCDT